MFHSVVNWDACNFNLSTGQLCKLHEIGDLVSKKYVLLRITITNGKTTVQ